ncbi:MAG: pyruvate dehydrogenase (acetyl-transferring) E1 component subunit alpha [Flavobacteriales bacterium]|nr:pyruvate dehydrogenase (acetyl-transferring) E1 component subunit alpha [Flavobacteriales bacterium]MCX7768661.1 pyruvate dehydrogenase (acetyl-transferring) E1 component subunit alpha [Flavobacteriales bacterium]MDW8410792.1 pyruvate dehydrogenase (acetyl-transferring) E1 component subunit alpha [Flavobacteriales bacterium]
MSSEPSFSKDTYLFWYEKMLLCRRFEEKCGELYTRQKFGGFCHLYIGQEAVVVGSETAIRPEDRVITAYRCHVHPIVRGMHPKYVMAELFGRATGCSRGRGGSMHMFSKEFNMFGGHGIVGGQIPLGAGIAFADKYRGNDLITLCFMGDGAVRQGAFHETLNMAMTWKLPVVFVIENNQYAMGTSVERTSNVTELYKLGCAYEMPSYPVDGMRCEAVHQAVADAAAHAREGRGPVLLEMRTYRYKGHSMSDPQTYRTKEEVEEYKALDPIDTVLQTIRQKQYATEEEILAIQAHVKALIEESVAFAEQSPLPDPSELYQYVYSEPDYPFIKD